MLIWLLVVHSSWALMKESVAVLMEGAPANVEIDAVRSRLMQVPGAQDVRDLHVWTITSGLVALSAHVSGERPQSEVFHALRHDLQERFGIHHTTIQFDPPEDPPDHAPRV
jgi:cobalt-zinc-cadmium efflux system protein